MIDVDEMSIEEKAATLALRFLEREITVAVGIPGTGPILNFISSFVAGGGQFLLCKHEASAPIIAGNIGRRLGRPMLAVCANGNARVNLLSGILHCWFERLPVICLWDDFSIDHPKWQKLQKLPNHDFDSFFNWVANIGEFKAEGLAAKAIESSLQPDHGPVGIPLCLNPRSRKESSVDRPDSNRPLLQFDAKYVRPAVIVGSWVVRSIFKEEVARLLEELEWPTITTIGAKGLVSERRHFNLRVYTGVGGSKTPEGRLLSQCDSIIGIGLRHSDVIKVGEFPKPTLLLDFEKSPDNCGFGGNAQSVSNISDLKEAMREFAEPNWSSQEVDEIRKQGLASILVQENPVGQLLSDLSEMLFKDVTVVVDDGVFQKQSEYLWTVDSERQFIATGVGRNMGSALPTAVGLSIAFPNQRFVALVGDGGLPLFLGELGMLTQYSHGNLLVVHIADYSLATMREKNLGNTSSFCEAGNKYGKVFSAFGFTSYSLSQVGDVLAIVDRWRRNKGDCFLEFEVPHDEYAKTIMLIRDRVVS